MIILDTNVVSEFMREQPDHSVVEWISKHKPIHLGVTTIAIAEIQKGLCRLPKGKRRTSLENSFMTFISEGFHGRIFSFDEDSAYAYGDIAAQREKAGFNIDAVDLMIAAIARTYKATIATRNMKDFEGCGIAIVNPWD